MKGVERVGQWGNKRSEGGVRRQEGEGGGCFVVKETTGGSPCRASCMMIVASIPALHIIKMLTLSDICGIKVLDHYS